MIIIISTEVKNENYQENKNESIGSNIVSYYIIATSIFIVYCMCVFFKKRVLLKSSQIINFIMMSSVIGFTLYFNTIVIVLNVFSLDKKASRLCYTISLYINCILGIAQFCVFLLDKKFKNLIVNAIKKRKLLSKLYKRSTRKEMRDPENILLTELLSQFQEIKQSVDIFSLDEYFEKMTSNVRNKQSLVNIFIMLCLHYLDNSNQKQKSVKKTFSKSELINLASLLCIDYITKGIC
jgi:hypothetical protein